MKTDTTGDDADAESTAIVATGRTGHADDDPEALRVASPPHGAAAPRTSWVQRRVSLLRRHYSQAARNNDSLRGETMNAVLGDMANTMAENENLALQNSKLSVKVSSVNNKYDNLLS